MWIILSLVIILLLVILTVVFPYNYKSPRAYWYLRKIPSLPMLPYFGCMKTFTVPNEDFLPLLNKLCNEHKPILRVELLGFSHIFLSDINDLMMILNSRLHTQKSEDYLLLVPWLGTGLLTSFGRKWFHHRKLLTPAFHFKILEQYFEVFNRNARILYEQLSVQAKNDFVEINMPISLCTLDVICETAMGTSVHAQTGGEKEYVKATLRMSQIFQKRMLTPWMFRNCIFNAQPLGKEHKKLLKILHGFSMRVIRERKEAYKKEKMNQKHEEEDTDLYFGVKKKMSFLDLMIKISETENAMTEEEIREEVDTFMFEGHDTTAAAISWALFELGHHPEIQERAYQEQFEIFQGSDRDVTNADLLRMKYLERVIKESLRLYPSVPVISRLLETDVTIKGYLVPAGTNVPVFIYRIHRDPEFYPDPLKFDPDRFLPENVLNRHPYAYIPFSAGSRNCIGQKFAEMEEKVILSHLIRNFKFTSLDNRENIKIMGEMIMRPQEYLKMTLTPRQQQHIK